MNTRIGSFIRARTTSERGSVPDLLPFMVLTLMVVGFGMAVMFPIAIDRWFKPIVEQDPYKVLTAREFFAAGTDVITPPPTCVDGDSPECAITYSDRLRRQFKQDPIVRGEPVVKCGRLVPAAPGLPDPVDARLDKTVITTDDDPTLVIVEDEQVACHVSYQRFQVGAPDFIRTLISDAVATYEGRADNAYNPALS